MENKIAVVISSCDRYSYLWDIQMQFFEKYWENCPYNVHLISDIKEYEYPVKGIKLQSFSSGKQSNGPSDWSNNLLSFLNSYDYEYVIYFQDDYIPYKQVDQKRLNTLIDYVVKNEVNYVRFYTAPMGNGESIKVSEDISIKEITKGSQWRHSLMLAIWKTDTLKNMLEKVPNITPWDFEKYQGRCDEYSKFYCLDLPTYDSSDIINFYGIYGSSNGFPFYPFIVELINREGIKKLTGEEINFGIRL